MAPDSGDLTTGELGRRLARLESKVDSGFESLQSTIIATSSTYVRVDLYLSEKEHMEADIEAVKKVTMWCLGLIISIALGAIVLGIIGASGAFSP